VPDKQYDSYLPDSVRDKLYSLAPPLRAAVEARLEELEVSPSRWSRPTVSPPYLAGGMMSELDCEPGDGLIHHFVIFFRFSRDETKIIVSGIGHTRFDSDPPDWNASED
jgi:hypothetical protein